MPRTLVALIVVALASIVVKGAPQAPAQGGGRGGGQPVQPIQMIKPGLYLIPGGGANSLVRVTKEGLIVVDTKLPGEANYKGMMEQIRTVSPLPVKFVVVTHHHADHTGNDRAFIDAGAQVIGFHLLATNLEKYKFDPLPAPPTITYKTDHHTIKLGGVEVRVLHFGSAHTSGDSIVYFPDEKVVATSDAVTTGTTGPLVDYAGGGSALQWTPVLDKMLKLDFDTAVPGAGPLLTKADVRAFRDKFNTVITRATALVKKGVPKEQLMMQLKTDDIGWAPRVPQVDPFYEELSKAK